jgi:phytoene dehydrogenase-like protein
MEELALADHGLSYLDLDPAQLHLTYDAGPPWPIFHDVQRTLEAVRLTHPQEVEGYRRYVAAALPVAHMVLEMANDPPSPGGILGKVASRRGEGVATLLRWSRRSVASVMRSFFATDALAAPGVVIGPAVWGLSPFTPGTGTGALTYAMKHAAQVGRPRGGSGALPEALLAALSAAGGTVRCGAAVEAIVCEGDDVRGVRLADATVIEAPIVVSACDPRQTFVSWLADPPSGAAALVERWRTAPVRDGYESKVDAVVANRPVYRGVDPAMLARVGVDEALVPTMIVGPGLDEMHQAHQLMGQGLVARRPMFFANMPSVLDPSMAVDGPDGGDVFSLETLFTPYTLRGGWTGSAEPQRWLRVYGDLVEPGFLDGVRRWRAMTPDRYEREFFMPRGYATSFAGGPVAALVGRQRELTRYETPVRGLYLTGAATFPGAGVWGASGRNTATVILRGRDRAAR